MCPFVCVYKQKSESEETESQKPHVKLRRSISEAPRPASTPPTIAGGEREEGNEEKLAAELEVSRCITWGVCTLTAEVLMLVINVHMSHAPDVSGVHPQSSAITYTHTHTHTHTHAHTCTLMHTSVASTSWRVHSFIKHTLAGWRCEFLSMLFGSWWTIKSKWVVWQYCVLYWCKVLLVRHWWVYCGIPFKLMSNLNVHRINNHNI